MNQPAALSAPGTNPDPSSAVTQLRGRWLIAGRMVWLAVALVSMAALVARYPVWGLPANCLATFGSVSMTVFLYLFPGGRFVPRWTRWLALGWIVFQLPGVLLPNLPFDNRFWPSLINSVLWMILLGGVIVAQVYRYRRVSNLVQRQQTKWVVFGMTVGCSGFLSIVFGLPLLVPSFVFDSSSLVSWGAVAGMNVCLLFIPLSIGAAIMRYRLWNIAPIINRTLVYGALTAGVVGIYMLTVGYLGSLFHTNDNLPISLLAAGLVAVLFQPLRERLQRSVNQLIYGKRDEPYAVLSHLGQRLEATLAADTVLMTIAETIALSLKLPYVAIALEENGERRMMTDGVLEMSIEQREPDRTSAIVAFHGTHPDTLSRCHHVGLAYQGEPVGQLILAPRAPGEPFSAADRRLLDDLAHQVGVAVHAGRLTADLRLARERLVTAREEERRRLRRDLHDGLGPELASHTLKLEAAADLVTSHPERAIALIGDLIGQSQAMLADIRRLVYALRPPALDELGLVPAIREQAAKYADQNLTLTVVAPEQLPPLPAAVEVAAYRIVQEALTNVVKHAQARTCVVTFSLVGTGQHRTLGVEISDDGVGLSGAHRTGVGLHSMRERSEELGGVYQIESAPRGGTRVSAYLPAASGLEEGK